MEDKNFWDQFPKGSADPSDEEEKTPTDAAIDPEYKADDKPTAFDPPQEWSLDIDAIWADIQENAAAKVQVESDTPAEPPHEENQTILEMTAAIRELSEELRQFRAQMEQLVDADHPQGIPINPGRPAHLGEAPVSTTETSLSGYVPDGNSTSEEPKAESPTKAVAERKKKNKVLNTISNILFYAVIVAMVMGAFLLRSTSKGQPFMLGGMSAANILTSSMEDVYPRGTLIITKQMDPKELMIGDDITFMVSEDTSITHRIIGITENYQATGQRAFETKGTNNPNPDKEMVVASNVVGKVIFSSKTLGDVANYVKANWPILIFVLLVIVGLITFLKWNAKKNYGEEDEKKEEKPISSDTKK